MTPPVTPASFTRLSSVLILLLAGCNPDGPANDDDAGTSTTSSSSSTTTAESSDSGSTSVDTGSDTSVDTGSGSDSDGPPSDLPLFTPCDILTQDCPDGLKCSFIYDPNGPENVCVPVQGSQAPGEPCMLDDQGFDDCNAEGQCWNATDGVGTCTPYCTGTPDDPMCPDGYACSISSSTALCVATCDPLLQDCMDGQGCYWTNNEFSCVNTAGGPIATGDPCGYINDCEPGNACLNADVFNNCDAMNAGCCGAFCDVSAGDGPCQAIDPAYVCWPFFEPGQEPPGYEEVGVCILPQ